MSGMLVCGLLRLTPRVLPQQQRFRAQPILPRWRIGGLYGRGRIAGTVTVLGQPASRRVRVYDLASGVLVGETWSSPIDGAYEIAGLNPARRYTVVGLDHTETHNAAIADLIVPTPA